MFKAESVLGLIGSILATIIAVLSLACCTIGAFFFQTFKPVITEFLSHYDFPLHTGVIKALDSAAVPALAVIIACIWFVLAAASFILGYVGTSMLKKDNKNGGVVLIVAAVLALFSVCNFIPFVLMLVGGIMAVSKRLPV
jgi:hypothetical protein